MAELKIRPLGDRVVVKASEAVGKTKGGIIIPDTAKEKPQEGKIVAMGKANRRQRKAGSDGSKERG